jgi:hypothetical protein
MPTDDFPDSLLPEDIQRAISEARPEPKRSLRKLTTVEMENVARALGLPGRSNLADRKVEPASSGEEFRADYGCKISSPIAHSWPTSLDSVPSQDDA